MVYQDNLLTQDDWDAILAARDAGTLTVFQQRLLNSLCYGGWMMRVNSKSAYDAAKKQFNGDLASNVALNASIEREVRNLVAIAGGKVQQNFNADHEPYLAAIED